MYYFFIDGVLLPVAPSKITMKAGNKNRTVDLADGTEYNILNTRGLTEISFDCLLPNMDYPFSVYENGFLSSRYFLTLFERLKTDKKIFLFCVERGEFGRTAVKCSMESYTVSESTKEGFDCVVAITLKEYAERKTVIVSEVANSGSAAMTLSVQRSIDTAPADREHKVVSGDTLWGIAQRHLGNGTRWKEIYADNADVIEAAARQHGRASSSGGWWIYPGTVLTVKGAIA